MATINANVDAITVYSRKLRKAYPAVSKALTAQVAARVEEVGREVEADLKAIADADAAYNLQNDADIAAARQRVAAHPTGWIKRIDGYCDDAAALIAVP